MPSRRVRRVTLEKMGRVVRRNASVRQGVLSKQSEKEATWELESRMRDLYPEFSHQVCVYD